MKLPNSLRLKLPKKTFCRFASPWELRAVLREPKNERELQAQIVAYLRARGIEVNVSRTDKRTTHVKGWPDLTFCVQGSRCYWETYTAACAWEIKFGKGKLSPEQEKLAARLTAAPNCWRFRVIRSLDEAREELSELGIENRK